MERPRSKYIFEIVENRFVSWSVGYTLNTNVRLIDWCRLRRYEIFPKIFDVIDIGTEASKLSLEIVLNYSLNIKLQITYFLNYWKEYINIQIYMTFKLFVSNATLWFPNIS